MISFCFQGIGPVDEGQGEAEDFVQETRCLWSDEKEKGDVEDAGSGGEGARHGGAINCIAAYGDRIATACRCGLKIVF